MKATIAAGEFKAKRLALRGGPADAKTIRHYEAPPVARLVPMELKKEAGRHFRRYERNRPDTWLPFLLRWAMGGGWMISA